MPVQIRSYYAPSYIRGMAVYVHKVSRRDKDKFVMNVDWYRKDDVTNKFMSMDLNQDIVIDPKTFGTEWKKLDI